MNYIIKFNSSLKNTLTKNSFRMFSNVIKDKENAEEKFYFDKEESILYLITLFFNFRKTCN